METRDFKLQRVKDLKAVIQYCYNEDGNVPKKLVTELYSLYYEGYYVPEKGMELNIGLDHFFDRIVEDCKGFEKANKVQQAIDILLTIKEHYEKDVPIPALKSNLVSARNLIEELIFE